MFDPPFKINTFDFISALNLIDSVKLPLTTIGQMNAMLKPKGKLFLSTPYTWNSDICEDWLETKDVDPHTFVKMLLTGGKVPETRFNYRILKEKTGILWRMRKQDTQHFIYTVDFILAEKV